MRKHQLLLILLVGLFAPPASANKTLGPWVKSTAMRVFRRVMPRAADRWQDRQRTRQAEQRERAEVEGVLAVANRSERFPFLKQIGKSGLGGGGGQFAFIEHLAGIDPLRFSASTPSQKVRFVPSEALVKQTIADARLVLDELKGLGRADREFGIDRHPFCDVALAAMEAAGQYTTSPAKLLSIGRYAMHQMAQIAIISEAPSIIQRLSVQLATSLHQALAVHAERNDSVTDLLGELRPDGLVRAARPVAQAWSWIPQQLHKDGSLSVDIVYGMQGANAEGGVLFRQSNPEISGLGAVQVGQRLLTAVSERMSASAP